MTIEAEIYREDGQWVIVIETEQWVLDDILHDVNRKNSMPVKLIVKRDFTTRGGTTKWIGNEVAEVLHLSEISADVILKG